MGFKVGPAALVASFSYSFLLDIVSESFSVLIEWWLAVLSDIVGIDIHCKRGDVTNPTFGISRYIFEKYIPPPGQPLFGVSFPGAKQRHIQPILQNLCVPPAKHLKIGVQ
jgi:hypothetical protein